MTPTDRVLGLLRERTDLGPSERVALADDLVRAIELGQTGLEEPLTINVAVASRITENSWLNEDRFEEFRAGYRYASTQTMAISGLAKLTPEELYYVWSAVDHGIERKKAADVLDGDVT